MSTGNIKKNNVSVEYCAAGAVHGADNLSAIYEPIV
jgi:hypothetical protein